VHSARFGIVGAVYQALDPGVHQGSGAHRARFNCSKQIAAGQAMVTESCTGFAQGNDLGMGCGVVVGEVAIPAAADYALSAYDDCAYWNFAGFEGALGGAQSLLHPEFVFYC
jgi:hypothetical protein